MVCLLLTSVHCHNRVKGVGDEYIAALAALEMTGQATIRLFVPVIFVGGL
jgi:hypothetical protein